MPFNLEELREIVFHDYAIAIEQQYGEPGMAALRVLAPALDDLHKELAYELIVEGLTAFVCLEEDANLLPPDRSLVVEASQLPGLVEGAAAVQIQRDGSMILLPEGVDPTLFSDRAVVYHFDGKDHFIVGKDVLDVTNPTHFPSVWGIPTFFRLQAALKHYRDRVALHCRHALLRDAWHEPERRWIFKNRPEDTLQEALYEFLWLSLREFEKIEIRREQAIEGTKPPDIKVTWSLTNRIAFIEVKWMGVCLHKTDAALSAFQPDEDEANRGAAQLAGYLDLNAPEAVGLQTMGFLTVFDGRRKDVEYDTTELSPEQALYYMTRDVSYDPDCAATRHDFAPPLRFFMRPAQP